MSLLAPNTGVVQVVEVVQGYFCYRLEQSVLVLLVYYSTVELLEDIVSEVELVDFKSF
jgi:hypothetical protein